MSTDISSTQPAVRPHDDGTDGSVVETVQSLIIAFVLAMTFRGFVTEGFVIPTGSMAPTLMGQHLLLHSDQTGVTYPAGLDQGPPNDYALTQIVDPMLGQHYRGSGPSRIDANAKRMGDRILVLKCLYPFAEPNRFDVVVFKNPTDPVGDAANYIKRLIGLPNEQVWLTDGDVFARPFEQDDFLIQRKPEHVQRTVWQTVHDSDYVPLNPSRLNQHYPGPAWVSDTASWNLTGRSYVCATDEPTVLQWDSKRQPINDWTAYNMLVMPPPMGYFDVSDVRVSAGVTAQHAGLRMSLELEARSHVFQFVIENSTAIMRMRRADSTQWIKTVGPNTLDLKAGEVFDVEFWHADQAMQMFINGKSALDPLEYAWTAQERLANACGADASDNVDQLLSRPVLPPQLRWNFSGSPVTLHRVRLDRDLHYRRDFLEPNNRQQKNFPLLTGPAFGTHPEKNRAALNSDQYMMCGDNNSMSLDSRLWGSPHPLIARQIDESPFVVNRKLLLGKAWVVYFPAPYRVIPDFGRLRFIR